MLPPRALLAALLLLGAPGATLVGGLAPALPRVGDADGDGAPDHLAWDLAPVGACAGSAPAAACAGASASLDAPPGGDGVPELARHAGAAHLAAGDCAAACASAGAATFYDQVPGRRPDITLHGIPDLGATGGAAAAAPGASAAVPFALTDTDHNNNTHASARAPHAAGPLAGEAGATAAVLVLLHHDRGLPHTRLAYLAPQARECLDLAGPHCAAAGLNHTYFHHDADDDVVHEEHRAGLDDQASAGTAACGPGCAPGTAGATAGAGILLEDSFFIVRPPSGVRGDGQAGAEAQGPILATPPAQVGASWAFRASDPDRDLDPDEVSAGACLEDHCLRLG